MAKKILVVEDEADILKEVSFILRKKGYDVIVATNGKEALELTHAHMPDLILLDLFLPICDGTVVGKNIKNDSRVGHIPILLLTASADNIEAKRTEAMADDHLLKPFDYLELLKKIEKLLP